MIVVKLFSWYFTLSNTILIFSIISLFFDLRSLILKLPLSAIKLLIEITRSSGFFRFNLLFISLMNVLSEFSCSFSYWIILI